ncbi:MAG: Asp-tRNA(Asn)/Glu-tRNA(Gln) amidotransferase GatCAB subunit B, partial [Rhodospirillales bacterium]|nr:Asp-tRNA(Asn)/Glu-tRNA(Gln) amidotransferase GatCAB subunit B [Rhodospirillales bacterium]
SVRFVMQAIEHEAERQVEVYESGGDVVQETRLYDPNKGETRSMRSKEEAHDYRYFPDPDLLPLDITQEYVDAIKSGLPELPDAKKERFISDFELAPEDAAVLVADKDSAEFFEALAEGRNAKLAANWVIHELFAVLNKEGKSIAESQVNADDLGKLIDLISDDTISGRIAKDVFEVMVSDGGDPAKIVEEKGLKQITDTGEIETMVDQLIADNPDQAQQYKDGNEKVAGWFVGQAMKASQGKANPQMVNELLKKKLG